MGTSTRRMKARELNSTRREARILPKTIKPIHLPSPEDQAASWEMLAQCP